MEPVDVLGHAPRKPARLPQIHNGQMGGVGPYLGAGAPQRALLVQRPAHHPHPAARHVTIDVEVLGIELGPQPVRTPEVGNPRLGGDTGSGEHHDL